MLWRQSGREKVYGKDTGVEVLVPVQEPRGGRKRARADSDVLGKRRVSRACGALGIWEWQAICWRAQGGKWGTCGTGD